jgi:molybdopterin-guanine dinucleotide biosynthesis protein A
MLAGVESGSIAATGVVLAGGLGSRMGGGSKPAALLDGRPLLDRPVEALGVLCELVAVVCKRHTELPVLAPGVVRWDEPDEPRHPLTGIVHALERAGEPVVVCGADMPFVEPGTLRALWSRLENRPAVVGRAGGRVQPLLAVYATHALEALRGAEPGARLTDAVGALDPVVVEVPAREATSVDTPEALRRAQASLSRA